MGRRLKEVRFDEDLRLTYPKLGHTDNRRVIYDPESITKDLSGEEWYHHNVLTILQGGLELGNHHHDFREVYFTPTGGFDVRLVDIETLESRKYTLKSGSRLLIPEHISHLVTASSGSVLLVYGDVPFDPKRLIQSPDNVLEVLASMI